MINYTKLDPKHDYNLYFWGNFSFKSTYEDLEKIFGPYHETMDREETGLFEAKCWLLEFKCGLKAGITLNLDNNSVTVHLDKHEVKHFLLHTNIDEKTISEDFYKSFNKETEEYEVVHPPEPKNKIYSLHRQDDNGNCFCMYKNLTKRAAECMSRLYTLKGHKQYYEVKKNVSQTDQPNVFQSLRSLQP